jgi:hypothetical protein
MFLNAGVLKLNEELTGETVILRPEQIIDIEML